MSNKQRRAELAHFLRTHRECLKPSQFSLPEGTKRRRTPGLRREELAQVAGVSLTWYMKLEQGQEIQVSAQVLENLAQALQLTSEERTYLYVLAREQLPLPTQKHIPYISEEVQSVLDALLPYPAFVVNERLDVVGWNRAASLVFADYSALSDWERNLVWIMFTRPDQRQLYPDWICWARKILALFRTSGGRSLNEAWFIERRDRLMQVSPEFREWWQQHEVEESHIGHKEMNHPLVGTLLLRATNLQITDDPNLKMFLYTPLPQADTLQKLIWLVNSVQADELSVPKEERPTG
ncbi:helix-turn-helix transcriptional regulator [Ktedonospora formicarum]|uniref:Transcriptional regulator n=1 Tax=Ktedonospora formicarum TaxID=2778364 RepID=A0A8J3IBC0_9CHLR|nr:helix-turn-helix transcriptional regulator [Ktedonospora formicarum]GHO48934.1 transcriptional regulator [Ktedonospora formicarum]